MAGIVWDTDGSKRFETGVDHCVLYVKGEKAFRVPGMVGHGVIPASESETGEDREFSFNFAFKTYFHHGVPWNGITSVSKSPSGAEANDIYADNIKYASIRSTESFGATIEAYTYPDEFAQCDGSASPSNGLFLGQQNRKSFGFSFRTDIGDDSDTGIDKNNKYKLHLIYNATASPSASTYSTINDSPEAITFSWELTTIPAEAGSYLPTSCITIDSTKLSTDQSKIAMSILEGILYGENRINNPLLPTPEFVLNLFNYDYFS